MITIVVPFHMYFNKMKKALGTLNKRANSKKMLFWKQEVLRDNAIALDITKRKLLYFNQINKTSACLIMDLKHISSCTIKKHYHGINAGGLVKKKLQDYLKSILLHLSFKNSNRSIVVPFYEEQKNKSEEAAGMEIKAKEWENVISKLLTRQIVERA